MNALNTETNYCTTEANKLCNFHISLAVQYMEQQISWI